MQILEKILRREKVGNIYCSTESWYMMKANVQDIAENHLGEVKLKIYE